MSTFAKQDVLEQEQMARGAVRSFPTAARAEIVNRTHRVIRERAQSLRSQRNQARGLWLPVGVCSVLLLMVCYAAWTMVIQNDANPTNVPEANEQITILMLWFLPVSVAVLATVWFRRGRKHNENQNPR